MGSITSSCVPEYVYINRSIIMIIKVRLLIHVRLISRRLFDSKCLWYLDTTDLYKEVVSIELKYFPNVAT